MTPLADGVKAVRSKLAGGRRGKKAPAEAPAAEASTSAQADATCVCVRVSSGVSRTHATVFRTSNVAIPTPVAAPVPASIPAAAPAPTPTPRKAAPKKRATTARGRATKGKTAKAKAAAPASPAPVPAPVPAPSPSPAPVARPSEAGASVPHPAPASDADALPRPVVPEHRRLKRQGALYFDKQGWPLPEGESLDKNGEMPISARLKLVRQAISFAELTRPRPVKPVGSIYGRPGFGPRFTVAYQPLNLRMPDEPIVFPSVPAQANQPAPAHDPAPGAWDPIVFPAPPPPGPNGLDVQPARTIGTRLTRQYAVIYDQDGYPLPSGGDQDGELEPIGEKVANILKANWVGPYPPTWRGSLFEPEDEPQPPAVRAPLPAGPAAVPNGAQEARPIRPLPPPNRRLRRHHAILIPLDDPPVAGDAAAPDASATPAGSSRIQRQNAVYLDKDGVALPEGEITTADAQFPKPPAPSGSASKLPAFLTRNKTPPRADDAVTVTPAGLKALFARRSQSQMSVYQPDAQKEKVAASAPATEEQSPAAAPTQAADEESVPAEELLEEQEVVEVLSADPKGKKRARSPEDEDGAGDVAQEDAPRVQRMRIVNVRSFTKAYGLLRVKVSMIPIPRNLKSRDKVLLLPAVPVVHPASKRSREEFEGEDAVPEDGADEHVAKKARVDAL